MAPRTWMRACALALFTALCGVCNAAPFTVPARIVIAPDAHRTEALAASELARYIELATGKAAPVTSEAGDDAGFRLVVGSASGVSLPEDLSPEGFVIERRGNDICLQGVTPRGTLYAAYRYLEQAVGWRWLQPDAGGEVLTDLGDPAYPSERVVDAPRFSIRGLVRPWVGVHSWYTKLGMNAGLLQVKWDLTSREKSLRDYSLESELGEHGFSVYGPGDRPLCPNDPSSVEHAVGRLQEIIDKHPYVQTFGVWPEDGFFPFCQCEKCGDFAPTETLDGRYLRILNPIAQAVAKSHPQVRVGFLAYNNYLHPPAGAKPFTGNTTLSFAAPLALASITSPGGHGDYVQALREWLALGVERVWVYEYYNGTTDANQFCLPLVHAIASEIKLLDELDVSGLMSQINNPPERNWGVGVNFYVMARLLWDPDQDVEALVADYCHSAFGDAAQCMARFVLRYEQVGTEMLRLQANPAGHDEAAVGNLTAALDECAGLLTEASRFEMRPESAGWVENWQLTLAAAKVMVEALGHWRDGEIALAADRASEAADAYAKVAPTLQGIGQLVPEGTNPKLFTWLGSFRVASEAERLANAIRDVGLIVEAPERGLRLTPLARNAQRERDQLVLYTPEYGASTGTNKWGVEVVIRGQIVQDVRIRQGNTPIPEDGVVLSGHGNAESQLWQLGPGDRVIVRQIKPAGAD